MIARSAASSGVMTVVVAGTHPHGSPPNPQHRPPPARSSVSASPGSAAGSGDASFTTAVDGVLSMATEATFPPYEYYDGDTIVGIDVEIAQAIADKLGLELQVTDIAFDSIIPGVQTGKYDIGLAGMTVTDERLEQVNFTDSYATGIQVVIVKEGGKVSSVDDRFAAGAGLGEVKSFP